MVPYIKSNSTHKTVLISIQDIGATLTLDDALDIKQFTTSEGDHGYIFGPISNVSNSIDLFEFLCKHSDIEYGLTIFSDTSTNHSIGYVTYTLQRPFNVGNQVIIKSIMSDDRYTLTKSVHSFKKDHTTIWSDYKSYLDSKPSEINFLEEFDSDVTFIYDSHDHIYFQYRNNELVFDSFSFDPVNEFGRTEENYTVSRETITQNNCPSKYSKPKYTQKYLNQFLKKHFGKVENLEKVHIGEELPNNYHIDNGYINREYDPTKILGLTASLGNGEYHIFLSPASFDSQELLYITLGHELMHVRLYSSFLMIDLQREKLLSKKRFHHHAIIYEWQLMQAKAFKMCHTRIKEIEKKLKSSKVNTVLSIDNYKYLSWSIIDKIGQ